MTLQNDEIGLTTDDEIEEINIKLNSKELLKINNNEIKNRFQEELLKSKEKFTSKQLQSIEKSIINDIFVGLMKSYDLEETKKISKEYFYLSGEEESAICGIIGKTIDNVFKDKKDFFIDKETYLKKLVETKTFQEYVKVDNKIINEIKRLKQNASSKQTIDRIVDLQEDSKKIEKNLKNITNFYDQDIDAKYDELKSNLCLNGISYTKEIFYPDYKKQSLDDKIISKIYGDIAITKSFKDAGNYFQDIFLEQLQLLKSPKKENYNTKKSI